MPPRHRPAARPSAVPGLSARQVRATLSPVRRRGVGTDVNARPSTDSRAGIIYGLAAYGFWGLMPLYFYAVSDVSPGEILAQRIFWCGVLLAVVLGMTGRWREMADRLRLPGVPRTFVCTAFLLTTNWLAY